jgi:hypothetical protein
LRRLSDTRSPDPLPEVSLRFQRDADRAGSNRTEHQHAVTRRRSAPYFVRPGTPGDKLARLQQRFPEHLTAFQIVECRPDEDWLAEAPMQSTG